VRVEHVGDQTTTYPEVGKERRSVDGASLSPPVDLIVVAVEDIVDGLYGRIGFAGIEELQGLQFFRHRRVVEQGKQTWFKARIDKRFHELQCKRDAVGVS